ncbi:hypothetical protein HC028_02760 [Planosporangium flavigriseum]|uniref:Uncharacterized protein n=1 Tax=Planosporangium flavigriseum TaxID=373681 RepID=A0A8J3LZU6_9ACTN|nr:hypothetical protein [Planosporangium flavigriseum]NJC63436.1 hypothetical protein [Planosporangium flavigriseum]GIG76506.1 hypothetical protein Pfl04_49100 [Planosporangium flavigriseum]
MSPVPQPPSRAQVESWFLAVLNGSQSRDAADRWATQQMWDLEDVDVDDEAVWWGLDMLCGIDLEHGPDGPYLYSDEQIRGWLEEFRARCTRNP